MNRQNLIQMEVLAKGTPRFYYIESDKMHLVPFPTNAQPIQYLYIATPNNHDSAIGTYAQDSYGGSADAKPSIPQAYHIYLCDYAKAMMHEEKGEFEISDRIFKEIIIPIEMSLEQSILIVTMVMSLLWSLTLVM